MTIDEAILYCEEVADRCDVTDGNRQCADDHRQLAEWLRELKKRRVKELSNNSPKLDSENKESKSHNSFLKTKSIDVSKTYKTCNNDGDLILRKVALDGINEYLEEYSGPDQNGLHDLKWCAMKEAEMLIKDLPSAQPEIGEWIEDEEQHHIEKCFHCSECGFGAWGRYEKTRFCGGCGSKMNNPYQEESNGDSKNRMASDCK